MPERVIRFPDPEERSRNADAHPLRDPSRSALIILLPVVKIESYEDTDPPPVRRGRRRPF